MFVFNVFLAKYKVAEGESGAHCAGCPRGPYPSRTPFPAPPCPWQRESAVVSLCAGRKMPGDSHAAGCQGSEDLCEVSADSGLCSGKQVPSFLGLSFPVKMNSVMSEVPLGLTFGASPNDGQRAVGPGTLGQPWSSGMEAPFAEAAAISFSPWNSLEHMGMLSQETET